MKSDLEIIIELQNNINTSSNFNELSSRHSAIFFKIASQYISKNFKEKRIEFFGDKDYYIYKIALDFDPTKKTKFSTYLANRIKWICINNYKSSKKMKTFELIENNKSICQNQNFLNENNIDYQECLKFLKKTKNETIYEIFRLRYLEGKENKLMPWSEVCNSEKINLSIQGCINVHDKFLKKLKTIIK